MEMRNCPRCNKLFTFMSSPICPNCEKEEEEIFVMLRDYIDENPSCKLSELSEATKTSPKRILKYIREGRLEISKGMQGEIKCESCGKPISRGKYCDSCVIKINHNVTDAFTAGKNQQKQPILHTTTKKNL